MSFEDPFDNAPLDTEPAEEAQQPVVKAKVTKAKPASSAESDGKVVLTFKGGRDFDAPWIVIHANGLQEAHDFVVGDNAALLAVVMERVQVAGKHFSGKPASAAQGSAQPESSAPPASQAAPGGETRYCEHGEMVFKSGVAKATGKPYSLFSCTAPREHQCKAQFLK
jgi:hypothetical protein